MFAGLRAMLVLTSEPLILFFSHSAFAGVIHTIPCGMYPTDFAQPDQSERVGPFEHTTYSLAACKHLTWSHREVMHKFESQNVSLEAV